MQTQRFDFILLKAYWEGAVSRQDVMQQFDIASTQATKDFKALQNAYPNALRYDARVRRYVPDLGMTLYLTPQSFSRYQPYLNSASDQNAEVTFIQNPIHQLEPSIYRTLHQAIMQKQGLWIQRTPFNGSEPSLNTTQNELFFPMHLIQAPFRWLVRGWLENQQAFVNLPLTTIQHTQFSEHPCPNLNLDRLWETWVDLLLIANPQLSADQKCWIEHTHGLKKGVLYVQTRAALIELTLEAHHLLDTSDCPPISQPLALGNADTVQAYLPTPTS